MGTSKYPTYFSFSSLKKGLKIPHLKRDALKILSLPDDKKTAKVSRLDTLDVLHHIMHQSCSGS